MENLQGRYSCEREGRAITVRFEPDNSKARESQCLRIAFQRTIRVPDDSGASVRPADLGAFPLYTSRDYAHRLPAALAAKGGVFFPMYQREAMWISFEADRPFMVKIYAGGVNAVSGEGIAENTETRDRRVQLANAGKSVQDYVVVPKQPWLEGVAVSPSNVKQFVAALTPQGYSVEAQLPGQEFASGLRFEITPSVPRGSMEVLVKTPHEEVVTMTCLPSDTIGSMNVALKDQLRGPPSRWTLLHGNRDLENDRTMDFYGIKNGDTLEMRILQGNRRNQDVDHELADEPPMPLLAVAAGGTVERLIRQDFNDPAQWLRDMTISIPVQMLNSAAFRSVTGQDPPPCPINDALCARQGIPYYSIFEEPMAAESDFDAVKSIGEDDQRGDQVSIPTRTVPFIDDPEGLIDPEDTLCPFRTVADLYQEVWADREKLEA
ncbi:hypothetical protein F4677DRAFT_443812 [Hypoxylon crocopeplum]|nr:hypothetical protein F4677DRAFT_443812 [Hypoxylon crocopeplum]